MAAAAAEIFINCLRQRRRRLENLSKFSVIGGGSAARLTPLYINTFYCILFQYLMFLFSFV
jgi:hypothetical protein